ncbi:hypothetical protein LOK49_LG12G02664 [Camellia lanceoleosa]|uniref:Uncharacterized protein n=1 Tax=Camellia lanceoleosa TaxID=1840588 RepID=A0ACC0FT20_9ERIC|nr:hypothetical protein LOK49_LG12G02664 [Camellia lanceoleosa]
MGVGVDMPSGVVLCGATVGVGVGVFGSKCGGWSLEVGGWVIICLRSLEVVRQQVVECSSVQWWVVWLLEGSGGVGVWQVVDKLLISDGDGLECSDGGSWALI